MAKKTNMKSVRLSDEVLEYVENFEGDGFNQKFENLVLFCMKTEKQKRRTIEDYDHMIKLKYRKLNALNDLQRDARIMTKQFLSMQHDLEKLQEYIQIIRIPDIPEEKDGNRS